MKNIKSNIMNTDSVFIKMRNHFRVILMTLVMISFFTTSSYSQLSGSYTIGDGQTYADVSAAITDLQYEGVSGPVVFNIIPGTYAVHVTMMQIPGASVSNTITFQSSTQDSSDVILQHYPIGNDDNWVFLLDGADNVNFRHLTFKAKGESLYSTIFLFDGFSSNITFSNNAFYGKYSTSATDRNIIIKVKADNKVNEHFSNFRFYNNYFNKASSAIFLQAPNDDYMMGCIVDGNIFEEIGYSCVFCNFIYAPIITGNDMEAVSFGFKVNADYGGGTYTYNKIYSNHEGISVRSSGPAWNRALIANNFITLGDNGDIGINIVNSGYTDVINNSVNNLSIIWESTAFSSAAFAGDNPTVTVKNNNFTNEHNGYCMKVTTPSVISAMSNNNLYTAGNYIADWAYEEIFDIAHFQAISGMNENSLSVYPHYTADRDLHTIAPWLNNKGIITSLVTDDIDGESRTGNPDIGADEFTPDPFTTTPLDGSIEYTIGEGGVYSDFESAMADALLKGISAPVTFGFLDGEYEGQFVVRSIPGSSVERRVTIQSASINNTFASLKYTADDANNNFVFKFYGADYITLKNLKLVADGALYARIIDLYQGADYAIIENDSLNGTRNTNANERNTIVYSKDSDFRARIIRNNYLFGSAYAIYMRRHQSNFPYPTGALIEGNTILNTGYSAIYLQFYESPEIIANTIESNLRGMQVLTCNYDLRIQKNKIDILNGDGIYMSSCQGNEDQKSLISNNFIHCGGTSSVDGIYVNGSSWQRFYNNSICISNSNSTSYSFNLSTITSLELKLYNNIFYNKGGGSAMCISKPENIVGCDYNNYFSIHDYLVYWGQNVTTLDALRSLNSMDEHSVFGNPHFVSNIDLHTSEERLNGTAQYLSVVPDDIDGDLRNPDFPDIGADEFTIVANEPPYVDKPIPDHSFIWNTGPHVITFLDTVFIDPDPGNVLTYEVESEESWIFPSIENNILSLAVGEGVFGSTRIFVHASDAAGAEASDTFNIEVFIPQNNPPVAVNDTVIIEETITIDVLANDYDDDGDEIRIHSILYTGVSEVSIQADKMAILYTPIGLGVFYDTITYIIEDIHNSKDTALVFVKVHRVMEGFYALEDDLEGLSHGTIKWGDYDDDGDLDLLQSGWNGSLHEFRTRIIDNTTDGFVKSGISMNGLWSGTSSSACWLDYDNDNDLDIFISGLMDEEDNLKRSLLYENKSGVFMEVGNTGFEDMNSTSAVWADINHSGYQDLIISGAVDSVMGTFIYYNNGHNGGIEGDWSFQKVNSVIPCVNYGELCVLDINKDMMLDVFICGSGLEPSLFYVREAESWTEKTTEIPEFLNASAEWADFDADGDLDLAIMGESEGDIVCEIYQNNGYENGGQWFTEYFSTEGGKSGNLSWVDFDNDGDLDLAFIGNDENLNGLSRIIVNNMGIFSSQYWDLLDLSESSLTWGDYDNDGDVDLAIQGMGTMSPLTRIYRNDLMVVNQEPSAPSQLAYEIVYDHLKITWLASTDDLTSEAALKYNIRVGKSAGATDIISPMSEDGFLKDPSLSNVGPSTSAFLPNLDPGTYYWSVQAVDQGLAASDFSEEATIVVSNITDFIEGSSLSIYPNPTTDKIWISISEVGEYDLKIFSLQGLELVSEKLIIVDAEAREFTLPNLQKGVYMIRMIKLGQSYNSKIIVL